jgi:hypothetical protein
MDRHVEIEDVADVGMSRPRGDVGGDSSWILLSLKPAQHRHARALVHVAMQRADGEAVLLERAEQFGTSRLRLQKMMPFFRFSWLRIRSRSASRFSKSFFGRRPGAGSPSSRSRRRGPPRRGPGMQELVGERWISGGMVAEKNSVCRVNGISLTIRSMSGMKPMSSIRSASSITRISTPVSSSLPRSKWSSRRPGVAISTSTPRSQLAVLLVEGRRRRSAARRSACG